MFVKGLHLFSLLVWTGSLLTVTRLLCYRSRLIAGDQKLNSPAALYPLLRHLYLSIELPAMVATLSLGIFLFWGSEIPWKAPWLHMKLTAVFLLIVCDLSTGWQLMRSSSKTRSPRRWITLMRHMLIVLLLLMVLGAIYLFK